MEPVLSLLEAEREQEGRRAVPLSFFFLLVLAFLFWVPLFFHQESLFLFLQVFRLLVCSFRVSVV